MSPGNIERLIYYTEQAFQGVKLHSIIESEAKKIKIMSKRNIQKCIAVIMNAREKDTLHINNPQQQIETLSLLVNELLKDNEDGKNDPLIGLYANIGRSLKRLIEYQKQN